MSERSRGGPPLLVSAIFVAVFAFLFIGLAFSEGRRAGEQEIHQQRHTAEYTAQSEEQIAQCGTFGEAKAVSECVTKVIEATNEHKRSEREIVAQTDMAQWAFWMLIVAIFTFGVTAAGVWYVRSTLEQTRIATAAALDTAAAAHEMNKIALEAATADRRPWIKITVRIGGRVVPNRDGHFHAFFGVTMENIGRTPASGVWPEVEITPWPRTNVVEGGKAYTAALNRNFTGSVGYTILPGEQETINMGVNFEYAAMREEFAIMQNPDLKFVCPQITVVVSYMYAGAPKPGSITRIFDMCEVRPELPSGGAVFLDQGEIPPERLLLRQHIAQIEAS